jgi:serine phosphatase RsbU (regulator of sigma subunit)
MVVRQLGVPVALVSLVDDQRQYFPGQLGLPTPWCDSRETPLSHSFCQHVVTSGNVLVIEDSRLDPLVRDNLAVAELNVIAYAGVPLTDATGEVLGSLCAIDGVPRTWTADQLEFLTDLAEACSSELRLRIAARTARASASRLALLAEVGRAVVTTLDAEESVARLARLVVPALGDWCIAGVAEDGEVRYLSANHRDDEHLEAVEALTALGPVKEGTRLSGVLLKGETVLLPDTGEVLTGALAGNSVMAVPLRARSSTLGYLVLGRARPYTESDLHDAADIGRRTGLALDNAALFRQQRMAAETLQRDLLTRLPEPDHLHVVARYVPAADSAQIGGDWYDAFLQPDGASVLVVGDVMGHDMRAAAAMGQLRNLVRGIAYDREDTPARLLSRVDRALRGLEVDVLATVLIARIEQTGADADRGLRRLRWSSAGHPPPFLLKADGTVSALSQSGELLLGIDPEAERTDHEVVLEPSDTVILYTDGLVERRDSPLDHGLARMRQALAGLAGTTLDELCDGLLAKMLPQRSEDDVALVAVRAFPEDRPRPAEAGPVRVPGTPRA